MAVTLPSQHWTKNALRLASFGGLFCLFTSTAAMAAPPNCDFLGGAGDPAIGISIGAGQDLRLGDFTRPDAGTATITITPSGTRSIPANLTTNGAGGINTDIFRAATATITGGAGCNFVLTTNTISTNLSTITFAHGAGYTLTGTGTGATGTLDGAGTFTFTIGVSANIDSAPGAFTGESFNVVATYN